ncbi:MAG: IclR family transcriptional regulator [Synergistaceae bacterium]|nr:IclR family transcriptional regulator [Synergistaceae bacterium]
MKEDSVRSVDRAFSILKAFSRDDHKLTLSELAERVDLPITTTLRIANTLEKLNMLQRHSDRSYSLGNQLYLLGNIAKANFRPQQIIYPYMKSVRDETKEAVSLYGVVDEYRVCFEHVESLLSMRCVMRIGDKVPLWAGAGGKALLAFLGEEVIEREIKKAYQITPTTVFKADELRKSLADVRSLGYAISHGDREEGIFSIAVPIFNRRGDIEYSFSVAGPAQRFTEDAALELIPSIQKMCREIATQI